MCNTLGVVNIFWRLFNITYIVVVVVDCLHINTYTWTHHPLPQARRYFKFTWRFFSLLIGSVCFYFALVVVVVVTFSIFHSCVLAANNCVVTWLLCRTYVCSWDRLVPLLLLSLVVCYNSWQQLLWDAALLLCKRAIAALHEHFLVILLLLLLFLLFLCISVMIWLALLAHYYCYCFGFYLMYRNVFGVCDFSLLIFFLNVVYIFLCWKIRNHKFFS